MSDFLWQRYEAIAAVLEQQCIAFYERTLRVRTVANGSRGRSMGALRAQAEIKKEHRGIGDCAGRMFLDHIDRERSFHAVRIIRIAPRGLDDDNLASSLKALRDGVARALGIDDRDPCVRYVVDQRRGEPHQNLVRLELYASEAVPVKKPPKKRIGVPTLNVVRPR